MGNSWSAPNSMNKFIKSSLLLLFICSAVSGQTTDPINTDRPDQSDGTYTMPKKIFQAETGFIFGKSGDHYMMQTTMLRYGITATTEARLLFDYGKIGSESGIFAPAISLKQQLVSPNKWRPEITAVGYIRLPFLASQPFRTENPAETFLLAFQNTFSDKCSIGYNMGKTFDKDNALNTWITSVSFSFTATKKLSFFSEYYSSFAKVIKPSQNADAGVLWLLNNNVQIDVALGSTVFEQDPNQYITTGISYRFLCKK
jgi:hypothetical protein